MARPTTAILSVDKIARAALRQVDETGTLRVGEVAAALGVRPSSLYNHLAGRAEIVEAMRAVIFDQLPDAAGPPDAGPAERLKRLLRSYRDAFARHPRAIPLLTGQTVSAPAVMAMYDQMAAVLTSCGVPEASLLDVITVLDSFVIGSALDLVAPDLVWESAAARNEPLRRAIESAGQGRERADRAFELGSRLLIDGIVSGG